MQKLQELRSQEELAKGFPDKTSCLSWAVKVESLLDFNPSYKADFSWKLMCVQSASTFAKRVEEMKTILDMAIQRLRNEIESDSTVEPLKLLSPTADYVHQSRLSELLTISSNDFDLSKLVRLLEELISCHREGNYYAVIMLCRAIIDHVPPIFGAKNFNEVVSNYGGAKSFKESMERLNKSSRKIADQHLHTQIRSSETVPTITQVDFSNDLDVLLSEIVRILKK